VIKFLFCVTGSRAQMMLFRQRFYMLVTACGIVLLNNSIFVAFAPISLEIQKFFNVSAFWVNALSWATVVADCALALPAIWIVHRFGCRVVLLASSLLNFMGCAVRFFGVFSSSPALYFWLLLVGQTLAAIAQPMLNSVPPQVSANWFGERERSVATAVISTSSLVGLGCGYALFAFAVPRVELLWQATLVQLALSVVLLVMSFFYKALPPSPPSASMPARLAFGAELRQVARSAQFWFVMILFSLPFGEFIAIWSTLGMLLATGGSGAYTDVSTMVRAREEKRK
jgi:FLVCR family MFS transporter 7